ncbi:hypothetical protein GOP47_0024833 [Adiantum capillus-veneris]|uniref:GRDP C2 domain-containing protein n=1 Tax=Adiantum capillus-veneris TaxID=13818 RepID=A0A9D4Z2Z9_ADICA|nr:hypothetical protein GOP47_0024833 [Adiantum capillus-veneris]
MERKCSQFKLETASMPLLSEVAWNHTWTLEVEKLTNGLRLELLRKHGNALKQKIVGSEILGVAHRSWKQLLATPTLSYDGWLSMSHMAVSCRSINDKPPSLLVSVSVMPPQLAPRLFRTINCIPMDDTCRIIEGLPTRGQGCWLTKTVLDHTNGVVFIVRSWYSDGQTSTPEEKRNCSSQNSCKCQAIDIGVGHIGNPIDAAMLGFLRQ